MKKKKEEERDKVETMTKKINPKLDQCFNQVIIKIFIIFGGLRFSPHQHPRSNEVDETYDQINYDPRLTSQEK